MNENTHSSGKSIRPIAKDPRCQMWKTKGVFLMIKTNNVKDRETKWKCNSDKLDELSAVVVTCHRVVVV
jgi:hypothetical protein